MAVQHVVTGGLGFTVPSFTLTDGFGDFTVAVATDAIERMTIVDTESGVRLTAVKEPRSSLDRSREPVK